MRPHTLLKRFGIELEYMIVDRESYDVRPFADQLFFDAKGAWVNDVVRGPVTWSNELVNHVIELKCTDPISDFSKIEAGLHKNILAADALLQKRGAGLLPGGMHPFMNPKKETVLWPQEGHEIYERYDDMFDCHRHGWANVQSAHLNISFQTDEEFEKLHAAIRVLLPIIPALTASSPIANGHPTGFLDTRLMHYKTNQKKLPALGGMVIPEPVWSENEYERKIFRKINAQVSPFNKDRILNQYFLNARGAIARFDRGSIEIRLIDVQECPHADVAFLSLIVSSLRALVADERIAALKKWETKMLAKILDGTTKKGDAFVIPNARYGQIFGLAKGKIRVKDIWEHLIRTHGEKKFADVYNLYLAQGTLAGRMLATLPRCPSRKNLKKLCATLHTCLIKNILLA